jgi:hypothetical protein
LANTVLFSFVFLLTMQQEEEQEQEEEVWECVKRNKREEEASDILCLKAFVEVSPPPSKPTFAMQVLVGTGPLSGISLVWWFSHF